MNGNTCGRSRASATVPSLTPSLASSRHTIARSIQPKPARRHAGRRLFAVRLLSTRWWAHALRSAVAALGSAPNGVDPMGWPLLSASMRRSPVGYEEYRAIERAIEQARRPGSD